MDQGRDYRDIIPAGDWTHSDFVAARDILGLTQDQLAAELGYTRQGIGRIERNLGPVTRVMQLAMTYLLERHAGRAQ